MVSLTLRMPLSAEWRAHQVVGINDGNQNLFHKPTFCNQLNKVCLKQNCTTNQNVQNIPGIFHVDLILNLVLLFKEIGYLQDKYHCCNLVHYACEMTRYICFTLKLYPWSAFLIPFGYYNIFQNIIQTLWFFLPLEFFRISAHTTNTSEDASGRATGGQVMRDIFNQLEDIGLMPKWW